MDINLKCRNGKPTDEERSYLERKLAMLERYSSGLGSVTVELQHRDQRGAGPTHIMQATLEAPRGLLIRAEQRDGDFHATVDALHDQLQRQLTRYKDRHFRRGHVRPSNGADAFVGDTLGTGDGEATRVVRTKRFPYRVMSSADAIDQMELLDHDFFVFTDNGSGEVNVVYRRKDGDYGLITPATEE